MKKNFIYPAIFHKEKTGYWVEFPDLAGCLTEGDTLEEAFLMAGDALYTWLNDCDDLPEATPLVAIEVAPDSIVQMVQPSPYVSEESKHYLIEEAIENGLSEKKLTKNQVATILNVDRSYITHIVNGKKIPAPEMAKRIALLLGFDWSIFYSNAEVF